MPIMQIDYGTPEYDQMVRLRDEILRRPLGLIFTAEDLEPDKKDILIAAFDDGRMIGCCILRDEGNNTIRLRQMAVRNNQQGKGIGQQIMRFAETLARDKGYRVLSMHARDTAIGFYEKQGYKVIGQGFMEVTIPHHKMEKLLI
ncbi:MAG: GNAT family N-acetyltransferase [Chitinophagaceae bacterium]|jgi:GNAT superfamily N-acetyltransferase|nr:GNAT family N-acetyltransferase [Chitinophagaceae bacterium]MCU0404746.1 GNAT family N-acetyltransferase [Chitinophagaceae bacterium]